jgi:hypothetical protein
MSLCFWMSSYAYLKNDCINVASKIVIPRLLELIICGILSKNYLINFI